MALQHAQNSAVGVALHVLITDSAVQQIFVVFFQTDFADVVSAAVVDRVDLVDLALADTPDITQHVGKEFTVRIVAHQLGIHFNAGNSVAVDRDHRDFFFGEAEFKRHFLIGATTAQPLFKLLNVIVIEFDQLGDNRQRVIQRFHPLANNGERIAGNILSQQNAVAIKDKTALGGDGHQLNAVAIRLGFVHVVVDDLQQGITVDQYPGHHHQHHRAHQHAALVNAALAVGVFKQLPSVSSGHYQRW